LGNFNHHSEKCAVGTVTGSFRETAPRKTAKNTVNHRSGGVGSVVLALSEQNR